MILIIICWLKYSRNLAVNKQSAGNFNGEIFNLRKLNELGLSKEYQIEITKSFAALDVLSVDEDMNRAGENKKEDIKSSERECLELQ